MSKKRQSRAVLSHGRTILMAAGLLSGVLWAPSARGEDAPAPPLEKPGWTLTFHDEFDRPVLDDLYWYGSYRSGLGLSSHKPSQQSAQRRPSFHGSNANYVIENGVLKLRIDATVPPRANKQTSCVSSIQTSDHRFGATASDVQVLDKFAQKYGWFEIRCRMPKGSGLHSAFWLLQTDPNAQEIAPDGRRRRLGDGVVEIDIFEQLGREPLINQFNVHFTKAGAHKHATGFDHSKEFHIWALEWTEGKLVWYLDAKPIHRYEGETPKGKMFILLGLYHGAGWTGPLDPNMPYPRDFEVDYVRVYARP